MGENTFQTGWGWKICHWVQLVKYKSQGEAGKTSGRSGYWVLKLRGTQEESAGQRESGDLPVIVTSDPFAGHAKPALKCQNISVAVG